MKYVANVRVVGLIREDNELAHREVQKQAGAGPESQKYKGDHSEL